jgi:hypothetical protein
MAAGLGFKEFTTGDVLTAADANGYLASQAVMVFADAAARTSAIASPQEGMVSYLKDTNATEYYSGSAWTALGGASGGITLITSTNMAGAASFTFPTIAGTYKDLIVIVKNYYLGTDFTMKYELNGDTTGTNYDYVITSGRSSGAFSAYTNTNFLQDLTTEGTDSDTFMYLYIPDYTNTIARKQIQNNAGFLSDNGGVVCQVGTHQWRNTAAITQIRIFNNLASNFTAGTVQLYGVN